MIRHTFAPIVHPITEEPGVHGVAIFDSQTCYLENLPSLLSHRLLELARTIFQKNSLPGDSVVLDCDGKSLLVVRLGKLAVAALLDQMADLPGLTSRLRELEPLLAPRPRTVPVVEARSPRMARLRIMKWAEVQPLLVDALSRLIARPLAQNLVESEMRMEKLSGHTAAPPEDIQNFCERVLRRIPLKSRHDAVRADLQQLLPDV